MDSVTIKRRGISIHAPTGGATEAFRNFWKGLWDFNPRSHGGSDLWDESRCPESCISIHAPTGGATMRGAWSWKRRLIFQSTLPRGERQQQQPGKGKRTVHFNPRSHGGSDQMRGFCCSVISDFNPRSHGGSDYRHHMGQLDPLDFNPRSHGGSDGYRFYKDHTTINFNPRSHGGSDSMANRKELCWEISIHAPTGGATIQARYIPFSLENFNPRSHGGSDM